MITFNVVREQYGWAVQMGVAMTTPFRSRDLALREANCLADAIRRHGARAEVVATASDHTETLTQIVGGGSARPTPFRQARWPETRRSSSS